MESSRASENLILYYIPYMEGPAAWGRAAEGHCCLGFPRASLGLHGTSDSSMWFWAGWEMGMG